MPEHISRYYEQLEDLESHSLLTVEKNPSLKIEWGSNRVLTENDLDRVAVSFSALPDPDKRDQHGPFNYYAGGLTFLSLNDIHWQCERNIVGIFFHCLKSMMEQRGECGAEVKMTVPLELF
jgi:hypothetical protein